MSLREFLLLKEDYHREGFPDRSIFTCNYFHHSEYSRGYSIQESSVHWYDIAKKSYEKYGDEGPIFDFSLSNERITVITLMNGHGGDAGVKRTLGGIYQENANYFYLINESAVTENKGGISLVPRKNWFVHFYVEADFKHCLDHRGAFKYDQIL